MIRVLHYIGLLELGGSQSFVMEIYRNIDRRKVQFDFVAFSGEKGVLYDEIFALGGKIFQSPKYNGINHIRFVEWWNKFLGDHQEYRVIHGHVRSVASIYLPIARKHRRFTVLHSHSTCNGAGVKGIIKFILQLPVRYQADFYMACSKDAGKWLFGKRIVSGKRYRTVPNAINAKRFLYDEATRLRVRNRYNIEDSFVIGHVGRFIAVKNHIFLLYIMREAIKIEKKVRLLLVGDGKLKSEIEKQCSDMGIADYVIFAGEQTDTENFYQMMDVFAFPSQWEGLGIAAIEAQASGLRCVVSAGLPEEIDIGAGLIQRLDINSGAEVWAKELLRVRNNKRENQIKEIKNAGFDITDNAKKMQQFYVKADRWVKDKNECI